MFMDVDHPKFNLDMEMLCLLPNEPHAAVAKEVSDDLGLANLSSLRTIVFKLKKEYGIGISFHNIGGKRHINIIQSSQFPARQLAEEYWSSVYGL